MAWLIYWLLSGLKAKKSKRQHNWWIDIGLRVVIFAVIIIILRTPALYNFLVNSHSESFYSNPTINDLGIFIALLGLVFSIWARISLGKNWGMPGTVREKPDLVTTGPYAYVRHPIYTGVIAAMLGTTLVTTIFWSIPFIVFSVYFIYNSKREEKDMLEQFPKEYKEYMKHTKFLIPFIY